MKSIVSYSVLSEKYVSLRRAIELRFFPFANELILNDLPIIPKIENDQDAMASTIIEYVKTIDQKFHEIEGSIMPQDYGIKVFEVKNTEENWHLSHNLFTLFGDKHRSQIDSFFQGNPITLDLFKLIPRKERLSGLKFQSIVLKISHKNPDEIPCLRDYYIELQHCGDSEYVYQGELYKIPHGQIQLGHNAKLEKDLKSIVRNGNAAYQKLLDNPAMFSPYATWILKLKLLNPNASWTIYSLLKDKIDEIVLELRVIKGNYILE